jgi:hypothetical protein
MHSAAAEKLGETCRVSALRRGPRHTKDLVFHALKKTRRVTEKKKHSKDCFRRAVFGGNGA